MVRAMVLGAFQGAVYALLAMGLALVYRTTRAVNFAQAELGGIAAFVAFGLFSTAGLPYGIAVILGVAAAVACGVAVERVVPARPWPGSPGWAPTLSAAGAGLLVLAGTLLVATGAPRELAPAVPGKAFVVGGAAISNQHLMAAATALVASVLLALLGRTAPGLAIRAAFDDPLAARLAGVSERAISRTVWGVAGLFGGLAGVFQAPLVSSFAPGFLTATALGPALAAVVVGRGGLLASSVAAIAIGVVQGAGTMLLGEELRIPGAAALVGFAIVLVALRARPGLVGEDAGPARWR